MKKRPYILEVVPIAIISLIITAIAFYSVGVVDIFQMSDYIDQRLQLLEDKIVDSNEEANLIVKEFSEDYEYRAKLISMLIAQNPVVLNSEAALEELKSLISADELSITDSDGIIRYSTSKKSGDIKANHNILQAADTKNFSKTILTTIDDETKFITGVSRIDENGIVQIIFSSEKINKVLENNDIELIATEAYLLKDGSIAIIDSESYEYISHSNKSLIGDTSQFTEENFDKDKGYGHFYSKIDGKKSLVQYRIYNDKILIGIIPKSELLERRNLLTIWLLIFGIIITIISYLSARATWLRYNNE